MTVYQIGPTGAYTGVSREIGDGDGFPPGWTMDTPPSVGGGEVAVHTPGGWVTAPAPAVADPEALAALAAAQGRADAQAQAMANLAAMLDGIYAAGFACDLEPVNGLHLQLRNADDKANWDIFYGICNEGVAAGAGELPAPQDIRTKENIQVTATFAQGQAIMRALRAWGGAVMANNWTLADAIRDAAEPLAVDLTAGWP